jgi:hypothetical protein
VGTSQALLTGPPGGWHWLPVSATSPALALNLRVPREARFWAQAGELPNLPNLSGCLQATLAPPLPGYEQGCLGSPR